MTRALSHRLGVYLSSKIQPVAVSPLFYYPFPIILTPAGPGVPKQQT